MCIISFSNFIPCNFSSSFKSRSDTI